MVITAPPRSRIAREILSVPDRACRLRARILVARLAFVEKEAGRPGLERFLAELPQELAGLHPGRLAPEEWVPFAHVVAMDRAVARVFAPEHEEEVYLALGRFAAHHVFAGGVPDAPSIHHHFWSGRLHHSEWGDFGTCTYTPLEAQALRMEYREYPVMSRVFCLSTPGFFEESLRILGGHDPIVEETTCQCYGDEACSFRVSWEC